MQPVAASSSVWGRGVRERRTAQGLTQTQLAALVGASQVSISRIETGSRQISDALRLRIALALGANPYELFPYQEDAAS